MNIFPILTQNLKLIPRTREDILSELEAMSDSEKALFSQEWLKLLRGSEAIDPWIHGFLVFFRQGSDELVGRCGFKGPPSATGEVEIAYGVEPVHQGKGYATEMANALIQYAVTDPAVRSICAHTMPEVNASTRVLTKCGFLKAGEVVDPEDGLVWRWER